MLVEAEGLDWGNDVEALSGDSSVRAEMEQLEDPLLELFRTGALLAKEQFLVDLRSSDGGLQIVARPMNTSAELFTTPAFPAPTRIAHVG
jgi:hypothetical protein